MKFKYFKNGNIHIRYESDTDDYRLHHTVNPSMCNEPPTYADMVVIIYNSMLDCVACENYDSYFNTIAIINHANGETYDYVIPYDDMDNFFAGKWVILHGIDKHAYVKVPEYFQSYDIKVNGKWYALYKLCDIPSIDFMREMNNHGCLFNSVSPQYAPEIKHCAMLVPHGVMRDYL